VCFFFFSGNSFYFTQFFNFIQLFPKKERKPKSDNTTSAVALSLPERYVEKKMEQSSKAVHTILGRKYANHQKA